MKNNKNNITLFLIISVLFGIYCFVFGQSGFLERTRLQKDKIKLDQSINFLLLKNKSLNELYLGYINGKYARQEAEKAGYIKPGSKVIFFDYNKNNNNININNVATKRSEVLKIEIEHLRILFISISALIVLIFVIRHRKNKMNFE